VAKTRVVLLIPTLDRSGAEKQCTLLAARLPRDQFDIHVVALTRGGPHADDLVAAGIPLTIIGKQFRFDPSSFWRLRRVLKRLQPDILHTWLFAANSYGRLCASVIPQAKIVVSERCVDSWKAGWQLWLDRRLISRTDRLVGNSQAVVDFYRDLGLPTEKLSCIPNGIDVISETPLNSDRGLLRQELNVPGDAFIAGYVGRLARQKRVEDLIWAVETLRQIRTQLHLVLIGAGPEREKLEEFTRNVNCVENAHFLGHREDATRFLQAMDVFCLASSFEGMSNSVMEAMAAGLPVIASDIPANRELVVHNETGFLCKLGDTVGYMQYLRRLIDEPGLGERLGAAGRERIRTLFSIQNMVDRYADLYRQLMGT
jgi:glycosyltransferase involved in cell wall biosynthesis